MTEKWLVTIHQINYIEVEADSEDELERLLPKEWGFWEMASTKCGV